MRKSISRRTGFLGAAAALAVLTALTGCIGVRIIGGVEDSAPHFRKGRARIEAIHRNHPDRQGQARRLRLLIHDGSSRKVIKLSIPVWIVEACLKAGEKEVRRSSDLSIERRYDVAWRSIRDISGVGPGLLVEVEDEKDRVLIWLE